MDNQVINKRVNVSGCKPHPRNYNTHDDGQVEDLRESLRQFGQVRSIVVQATKKPSEYLIVAGHGVTEAARREGIKTLKADVIPAAWRPARVLAYLAADNELARRGNPDEAQLAAIVAEVQKKEGDVIARLAAGEQRALDNLLRIANAENGMADAEPQIDRAEELNRKWKVRTGDLWRIGEHRLLCGDSTRREDAELVMMGEKAETIFTSPPYSDIREYHGENISVDHLSNFVPTWKDFCNFQAINLGIKRKNDEIVEYWNEYIRAGRECGYKLLSWNVWDKGEAGGPSNQLAMFSIEHEFIFVLGEASKALVRTEIKKRKEDQKPKLRRQADGTLKRSTAGENYKYKNAPTIFRTCSTEHGSIRAFHPATMPVELPTLYIKAMTAELDIVSDPFAGSGTTLVACQNLQRKCRAIEISPAYCAVILERMAAAFPGIEIERLEEGSNGTGKRKARQK